MAAILGHDAPFGAEQSIDRCVCVRELLKRADCDDIRTVELAVATGLALDRRFNWQVGLDDPARQHSVADGPSARSAEVLGNDCDPDDQAVLLKGKERRRPTARETGYQLVVIQPIDEPLHLAAQTPETDRLSRRATMMQAEEEVRRLHPVDGLEDIPQPPVRTGIGADFTFRDGRFQKKLAAVRRSD